MLEQISPQDLHDLQRGLDSEDLGDEGQDGQKWRRRRLKVSSILGMSFEANTMLTLNVMQSGQICAKSGSDWPQMEQIRAIFQIRFQYILAHLHYIQG